MKYRWGDLISLEYGKPVKDKISIDGPVPVFGTNGKIGTSHLPPLCPNASFILGRKGAYRGVHYSDIPFSVIDTAFYAKNLVPNILSLKWAYYMFLTYDINSMDSGSAIPSTDRYEIYAIEVDLPPFEDQLKVVRLLEILDRKIASNQEINDNLERQARMLFRQWMVESEGNYMMTSLGKITEINLDTYSPKEAWSYINYLDTSSITKGIVSEIQYISTTEKIPSRARRKVLPNDIVYSTVRPNQHHYGIISYPMDNMLVSTGFAVIRSKCPNVCNELIYLAITENEAVEKMQQIAEQSTSTFPAIKPSDLGSWLVPCPIEDAALGLSEQLKSIYSVIATNNNQNKFLTAIRDTLLPKLMSGEIDVSTMQVKMKSI